MASKKTRARSGTSRASGKKSKKSSKSRRSRRRKVQPVVEPLPARALQLLILGLGMFMLFGALIGLRWGLVLVGVLILISAFPPLRRHVDKWLVGKIRGDEANQSAIIRMGVGIAVLLASFVMIL